MALLVFTLTATFDTETTVSCRSFNQHSDQENYTIIYETDFPFDYLDVRYDGTEIDLKAPSRIEFNRDYGAMAQSFLAWGVITLIYCIMAVFAYVMLNESQEWKYYEKTATIVSLAVSYIWYIVFSQQFLYLKLLQDFGGTMLWSILWLIVSVVWTVGSVQLENFIEDSSICPSNDTLYSRDDADFLQTNIAVVRLTTRHI